MKKFLVAGASICAMSVAAHAADVVPVVMDPKDWFVKIGGSYVMPDSNGTLLFGGRIPVTVTAGNAFTGSIEAGRFLNDRFSVSLSAGIPPSHEIFINGVDQNSTLTMGAFAVDGQFHLVNSDKFDAYVGGGLAYNVYFSTTNPGITSANNGFAPVLQAGVEYKANNTFGLFVDVKKEFFTTTINYIVPALSFQERLDPLVVTAGVAVHF
ncbi:MAG TPA: OmpW family outer membrane protein [Aestuariivirga sp.]